MIAGSAAVIFVSVFLPWRSEPLGFGLGSLYSVAGTEIGGGRLALFAALLGLGALAAHVGIGPVRVSRRAFTVTEIASGAFCLLVAIGNMAAEGRAEFGLYLALLASIAWTGAAATLGRSAPQGAAEQDTVPEDQPDEDGP